MKIFVSSVIGGLEEARDAAKKAIETLGGEARRAEDFGASPDTPQRSCLAGVREADAVILIMGVRYGDKQVEGLSATHEEYREAKERCPVLVLVQEGIDMEPEQAEFLKEVQDWSAGHSTQSWKRPEDLHRTALKLVHDLEMSRSLGPLDEEEVLQRSIGLIPTESEMLGGEARIVLAVAGGPRQQVLRPSELEDPDLHNDLMREMTFGSLPVFDPRLGTQPNVAGSRLHLAQEDRSITVSELGEVRIILPATTTDPLRRGDLPVLIEEDIVERIETMLRAAGWILDFVDRLRRLSDVAPSLFVTGGSYLGWRTRAEQLANPSSYSVNPTSEAKPVHLAPALRKRASLTQRAEHMAQDLMVLVRRQRR